MPPNDLIRGSPSAPPLPSNGEGDEFLTFVVDRSFIRQLVDQFGSTSAATEALKEESTAFEMPTSFARRIYLFILTSQTQGTEVPQPPKADSKVKRQPIAEVQIGRKEPHRAKNSPEIADLEDLEQRFPTVDKSVIDFVYNSEKRCVKNAVKHIEEIMKREKCSKHELDVVLERQRAHIEQHSRMGQTLQEFLLTTDHCHPSKTELEVASLILQVQSSDSRIHILGLFYVDSHLMEMVNDTVMPTRRQRI